MSSRPYNPDKQYVIVFADGGCSQGFLWRDQAVAMVNVCRVVGDRRPVGLLGVTPKAHRLPNNFGRARRR